MSYVTSQFVLRTEGEAHSNLEKVCLKIVLRQTRDAERSRNDT